MLYRGAYTSVVLLRSFIRVLNLKRFTTIGLRWPMVLLIVYGALRAARRNQSKKSSLKAIIVRLLAKIGVEWARARGLDECHIPTPNKTSTRGDSKEMQGEERAQQSKDKWQETKSLTPENEVPRNKADEVTGAQDIESPTSQGRLLEYERLVAEKNTLIADLKRKINRLEFDRKAGNTPKRPGLGRLSAKEIGNPSSSQTAPGAATREDFHEREGPSLNAVRHIHQSSVENSLHVIGELEGRVAGIEREGIENGTKVQSLLGTTCKQEERLDELEARMRVLTSIGEDVNYLRGQEQERLGHIRRLYHQLEGVDKTMVKVESKVEGLRAEAEGKDRQIRSLFQARQELAARVTAMEKPLANLLANIPVAKSLSMPDKPGKMKAPELCKGSSGLSRGSEKARLRSSSVEDQGSKTSSSSRPLPRPPLSEDGTIPDAQTCVQYEGKIAELTDKLSECYRLLKTGFDKPLAIPPRPLLGPPPYEPATPSYSVRSIG